MQRHLLRGDQLCVSVVSEQRRSVSEQRQLWHNLQLHLAETILDALGPPVPAEAVQACGMPLTLRPPTTHADGGSTTEGEDEAADSQPEAEAEPAVAAPPVAAMDLASSGVAGLAEAFLQLNAEQRAEFMRRVDSSREPTA